MKVAIPKETGKGEHRVAVVPHLIPELTRLGFTVLLEEGAGLAAHFSDEDYAGVILCKDLHELYQDADVILKIDPPTEKEIKHFKKNAIFIGLLAPYHFPERIQLLSIHEITSFAMEFIPRISRAQSMDALSSQATVAGYKAVLLAANLQSKFFPMLTTAAGTIRPINTLVIGAGVAGLQAIATARRLGAIVKAYDIRPAAREQIESLGAKMITVDVKAEGSGGYARELTLEEKKSQQLALFDAVAKADVIICTALIPGKPAPLIITSEMVKGMARGSVIVDIAASAGGNCELTQANKTICENGIIIDGPTNLPSLLAKDASTMYAKNLVNFLTLLVKEQKLAINWEDQILANSVLTFEGQIKHQPTRELIEGAHSS